MKQTYYDSKHEISRCILNECNMAEITMRMFIENFGAEYAAKKHIKNGVRNAQKVHVIHPCNLVKQGHINIEKLKKADKVVVIGCFRKDDFKQLDNVEFWSVTDIQKKAKTKVFNRAGYSEIKVNYGCNHNCRFCPVKRKEHYSLPINEILKELGNAEKVRLCSDDLASYKYNLIELLEAIPAKKVELTYVYPTFFIKHADYFIKNRDRFELLIPMQSGSNRILQLMGRNDYKTEDIEKIVSKLNNVTCHLMYGSPTETFEEFLMTFRLEKYFQYPLWLKYTAYEGTAWHKQFGFKTSDEIDKMENYLLKNSKGFIIDWDKNEHIK